jgi:NitT/TauT family transport system ATP-binding protein
VIEFRGVSHRYAAARGGYLTTTHALEDVNLIVPARQFISVVGPSGCGKTTLLRILAGLVVPSEGEVAVDGRAVKGPGPDRALVFQHAALFPWRTVAANVGFGLEVARRDRASAARRVERQLALVGLSEFADHYPNELSGGMQQRVGLARALAVSPEILLMDEPFGSLDAITRTQLAEELVHMWEHDQRTVVFVTHSLDEALLLSDRVVVMRGGRIVDDVPVDLPRPRQPDELLDEPEFLALRRALSELL